MNLIEIAELRRSKERAREEAWNRYLEARRLNRNEDIAYQKYKNVCRNVRRGRYSL